MKRIGCMIICIMMMLTGVPALAWGVDSPLKREPFYDPSSHILSGTLLWTDTYSATKGVYRMHYTNLNTGETGEIHLNEYYYLVYSDLPGAVVAKESNGKLFLYQMDLEGNLTPILETDLPTTSYVSEDIKLPVTVWAYYDGWLYYNLSECYYDYFGTYYAYDNPIRKHINLVRVNPKENKLFAYRRMPTDPTFALSPDGKLAWIENHTDGRDVVTLFVQDPTDGSVVEIPFTGEVSEMTPVSKEPVWANEDMLVFCGVRYEDEWQTHPLYAYHHSSKTTSAVKRADGSHMIFPYSFWYGVQLSPDKSQLFVSRTWDDCQFCVVDISTGKYFRILDISTGFKTNRYIWYTED